MHDCSFFLFISDQMDCTHVYSMHTIYFVDFVLNLGFKRIFNQ